MDKSDDLPPSIESTVMAAGGESSTEKSEAEIAEALQRANELKMEAKYSEAIQAAPEGHKEVATFYNNRATCHFKLGNYSAVIADCSSALKVDPDHLKCLIRRAQAYELDKKICEAYDDYQRILKLDATNSIAVEASRRLEKPVAEERERLKEEMLGKLKDLGNTVLGKFGLSLDNFKATKDLMPLTVSNGVRRKSNPQQELVSLLKYQIHANASWQKESAASSLASPPLLQSETNLPGSWIEIDWTSDHGDVRPWVDVEWMPEIAKDNDQPSESKLQSREPFKTVLTNLISSRSKHSVGLKNLLFGRRTGLIMNPSRMQKDQTGLEDLHTFWNSEEFLYEEKENVQEFGRIHRDVQNVKKPTNKKNSSNPPLSKMTELSYTMKNQPQPERDGMFPIISLESFEYGLGTMQDHAIQGKAPGGRSESEVSITTRTSTVSASARTAASAASDISTTSMNLFPSPEIPVHSHVERCLTSKLLWGGIRQCGPTSIALPTSEVEHIQENSTSPSNCSLKSGVTISSLESFDIRHLRDYNKPCQSSQCSPPTNSMSDISACSSRSGHRSISNSASKSGFGATTEISCLVSDSRDSGQSTDSRKEIDSDRELGILRPPAAQCTPHAAARRGRTSATALQRSPSSDMELVSPSPAPGRKCQPISRQSPEIEAEKGAHLGPVLKLNGLLNALSSNVERTVESGLGELLDELLQGDETQLTTADCFHPQPPTSTAPLGADLFLSKVSIPADTAVISTKLVSEVCNSHPVSPRDIVVANQTARRAPTPQHPILSCAKLASASLPLMSKQAEAIADFVDANRDGKPGTLPSKANDMYDYAMQLTSGTLAGARSEITIASSAVLGSSPPHFDSTYSTQTLYECVRSTETKVPVVELAADTSVAVASQQNAKAQMAKIAMDIGNAAPSLHDGGSKSCFHKQAQTRTSPDRDHEQVQIIPKETSDLLFRSSTAASTDHALRHATSQVESSAETMIGPIIMSTGGSDVDCLCQVGLSPGIAENLDNEASEPIMGDECLFMATDMMENEPAPRDAQQLPSKRVGKLAHPKRNAPAPEKKITGKQQPTMLQPVATAPSQAMSVSWASGWEDTGRGRRNRIRPLQFWRHERVEYARTTGAPVPEICTVIIRSPDRPAEQKRGNVSVQRSPSSGGPKTPATTSRRPRERAGRSHLAKPGVEDDCADECDSQSTQRVWVTKTLAGSGVEMKATATARQEVKGIRASPGTRKTSAIVAVASRSRKRDTISSPGSADPERPADTTVRPVEGGTKATTRRRLYAAAIAAFRDDRFDD